MTNLPANSDPISDDHTDPTVSEQIEATAKSTTEIAKDHVWIVSGALLLLGILIGAAATHASTPEPTVRHVARRSLHSAQRGTRRATRQLTSHLPTEVRHPTTLIDRITHALGELCS